MDIVYYCLHVMANHEIAVLRPAPKIDAVSAQSFSSCLCISIKYDRDFCISGRRRMDDENYQV